MASYPPSDESTNSPGEAALRESEARFRTLVEHAPEAIVLLDVDQGRFTDANGNALRLFGLSRDELLQCHPADVSPPLQPDGTPSAKRAAEHVDQALQGERPVFDWTHRNSSGDEVPCEVRLVRLPAGEKQLVRASITDISARKKTELALRNAKEAAEAANRAKGAFLANMSHEIRTPLNAVIGMTEIVLDSELTPTQREYLSIVKESGEALLGVINDILDFSKIEAGKLVLESRAFNLSDCLGNTLKTFATSVQSKGVELTFRTDPDVPTKVTGDADRLRQIIINLVGNAIKFTASGEISIDVNVESITASRVELRFTVQDTGSGIPQEKIEHIFEPFEQADTTTTRRYGGTGLGLTITARLVELMGGRIWAESKPGYGSQFHFTARFGTCAAPGNDDNLIAESLTGLRVLVVDDNATNRRILAESLLRWQMAPTIAGSAVEALQILDEASSGENPIQLVLSDVQMPDYDGYSLVKSLRQDERFHDLPIVMLTSGSHPDESLSQRLHIGRTLIKPVQGTELLQTIASTFGEKTRTPVRTPVQPATPPGIGPEIPPLHILLAEDSLPNQKLAVGLLNKWGHTVSVASNGREAVELHRRTTFDLVLMDIQMPELDGFQATALIREHERNTGKHIPIIALTAHAMSGDQERCLAAGMDGYVSKPIRQEDLNSAILKATENKASHH